MTARYVPGAGKAMRSRMVPSADTGGHQPAGFQEQVAIAVTLRNDARGQAVSSENQALGLRLLQRLCEHGLHSADEGGMGVEAGDEYELARP